MVLLFILGLALYMGSFVAIRNISYPFEIALAFFGAMPFGTAFLTIVFASFVDADFWHIFPAFYGISVFLGLIAMFLPEKK
jgi:hypothetical protein